MPRTTRDLDISVLKHLKRRGLRDQKSLGRVASEMLARCLELDDGDETAAQRRWRSSRLGAPHVDLEDKGAVLAALAGRG